jgi:hypothetical protein
VILIAITLIAAIAIAGFVFGLFGTFTSTAQVSITAVNCVQATGKCTLTFHNVGNSATTATGCSYSGQGGGAGTLTGAPITIGAGATVPANVCTAAAAFGTVGQAVSGSVSLSNGGSALFSGTWQ